MEEAEKRIKRETPPGGSQVDTHRRLFQEGSASWMKIYFDVEDSWSSEGKQPRPPVTSLRARTGPQKGHIGPPRGIPRLRPFRDLQRSGRMTPPATPKVQGLPSGSGRSRQLRRSWHPSGIGLKRPPTSLPQQGKHRVPAPCRNLDSDGETRSATMAWE